MLLYSERLSKFSKTVTALIEHVLSREVGLKVTRNRFWNAEKTFSYPISVVIFNHKPCLGYFDSQFLELGFHVAWSYKNPQELLNVIRHELAHYLAFIKYGTSITPHGQEFKELCKSFNWGEQVYSACQEFVDEKEAFEEEKVRKIQKLLALSSSANAFEAEQALLKARALMLKHAVHEGVSEKEEMFHLVRVMHQPRVDGKMRAIAKICETFFVSCVFSKTAEGVHLELLGQPEHVQIAQYVADSLSRELEHLWQNAKKTCPGLQGQGAKNAFFLGVAKGYSAKVDAGICVEKSFETTLIVLEKQLTLAKKLAYKSLRTHSSSSRSHQSADRLGQDCGKQLSIKPGLTESMKSGLLKLMLIKK